MADELLREVERRYRETKSHEDEVSWLRARLRAGALSLPDVELAAHLLHPAAIEVSTGSRPSPRELRQRQLRQDCDLRGWVLELARWGKQPPVRAALTAAKLVLDPESGDNALARASQAALAATEAWLDLPSDSTTAAAAAAAAPIWARELRNAYPMSRWRRAMAAGLAALAAGDRQRGGEPVPPDHAIESAARHAAEAAGLAALTWGQRPTVKAITVALLERTGVG